MEFFEKLEDAEGPDAIEDFQASHSRSLEEPLFEDQDIEQKLTQFMEWLVLSVNACGKKGGAKGQPGGGQLTKAAVSRFKASKN